MINLLAFMTSKKGEPEGRDIRGFTFGLTKKNALKARKKLEKFYKEFVGDLVSSDTDELPDEVWQLNFQFFKLTNGKTFK